MRVNGRATEQEVLPDDTTLQQVQPGAGREPLLNPISINPETGELTRDPLLITIKPPERPL